MKGADLTKPFGHMLTIGSFAVAFFVFGGRGLEDSD
jgi:hypothetical protein